MIRRATRRRTLAALSLLGAVAAVPSLSAQQAGQASGLYDPRSGRFSMIAAGGHAPDTLAVDAEKLWIALPAAYNALGVPVTTFDTTYRYLGALRVTTRHPVAGLRLSSILECGTGTMGPNAERYTVQLTLLSAVKPIDSTHSLLIVQGSGNAAPNGLNSTVTCESSGTLEEKLVAILRKQLEH